MNMFLANLTARFFMHELRSVIGDTWGEKIRMTQQLRRCLQ
jgi:hypothetical protein